MALQEKIHPIRILLRSVYDEKYTPLKKIKVVIRHRGAPNDEKTIKGDRITKVTKYSFYYLEHGEEVCIPAHRILRLLF